MLRTRTAPAQCVHPHLAPVPRPRHKDALTHARMYAKLVHTFVGGGEVLCLCTVHVDATAKVESKGCSNFILRLESAAHPLSSLPFANTVIFKVVSSSLYLSSTSFYGANPK